MTQTTRSAGTKRISSALAISTVAALSLTFGLSAAAVETAVELGNAKSFAVLAGAGITNTGPTPATTVAADLGGQTLTQGVYNSASSLALTGTLILDAENDASAVWIFQAGSTLTTASGSSVQLINGADACNVFWQVGSSATFGTATSFTGHVLALTSITANTGATFMGSLLARPPTPVASCLTPKRWAG
jgi:hypothetical protein